MQLHPSIQMFTNLKEIIEKNDLLSKYQYLLDSFNKAGLKTLSDTVKTKIEESLTQINQANQELTAMFWNASLKEFFPKIAIENILKINLYDISSIKPEKYQSIIDYYSNCSTSIKAMLETTQHFIKEFGQIATTEDNLTKNDELIKTFHIYFINNTSINTFNELEKYTRIWNNILISFSKLTKEEETPINVQFVDKNALFVSLGVKTIHAILKALAAILLTQRRRLEIRNLKQEIHQVELSNEAGFEVLLEEELTNVVDEHSSILTKELMETFELNYFQNQEIYDNIQIASKQLLNFIEKGGKIDTRQNKSKDELNEINKSIINEFIQIEHILKTTPTIHN